MLFRRSFLFLTCLICVWIVSRFVDRGKIMTPEITVPYFSGASLLNTSDQWIFNLNEVDSIQKLAKIVDLNQRRTALDHYRFSTKTETTHTYQLNQPGLVYIIALAKNLFFFTGEIGALKLFQLFIHTFFCFLIIINLKTLKRQALFFFLYAINPAIIYLTVFPFYYFWQVIGSYFIVLLLLNKSYHKFSLLLFAAIVLAIVYHVRISTFPLSILVLTFGFYSISKVKRIIGIAVFIIAIFLLQPNYLAKHPGHVMYSSLGAYSGSPVHGFSDTVSFRNYSAATGKYFSYMTTPSMYDAELIMGESKWGMKEFMGFAKSHPLIIARNATLNILESFSIGYITSSINFTYLSAFLGACFLCFLLIKKKYSSILLLVISTCSYVLYLAPVPIYLYGTYILSVYVFIELVTKNSSVQRTI